MKFSYPSYKMYGKRGNYGKERNRRKAVVKPYEMPDFFYNSKCTVMDMDFLMDMIARSNTMIDVDTLMRCLHKTASSV